MLRILSLLLLSLVLLTTACSKDDPEPEPTLEGTWKLQESYIKYYRADGSLESEGKQQLPDVTETITFTDKTVAIPTTYLGYDLVALTGTTNPATITYSLRNDTLTWVDNTSGAFLYRQNFIIAELTSKTLDLQRVQYVTLLPENTIARRITGGRYSR